MLCIRRLHGVEYNHEFYLKKQKRKIYYDSVIVNCSHLLLLYRKVRFLNDKKILVLEMIFIGNNRIQLMVTKNVL